MPISNGHYNLVRDHFLKLLGDECCVCGSVFNIELHHKQPLTTLDGRGSTVRMWEWFKAYSENNLSLLCHECHVKFHQK